MIRIENLTISYYTKSGFGLKKNRIVAVDGVNLEIGNNEIIGLVGESGCGKSTLGRGLVKLLKPEFGSIYFEDKEITSLSSSEFFPFRKNIQIIFQDPYSSLNPRMTIAEILMEGLEIHEKISKEEAETKIKEILEKVNLSSNILSRFPHEFSGGQRQRIAIARALVLRPKFVICDESVSALDVSTGTQVLKLLVELKNEFGLSYLFISHDLGVVKSISDRIAVMYLGKIVELGNTKDIVSSPAHPYTKALFQSTFDVYDRKKNRIPLKGEIPSIVNKPTGCHFHTRCPIAQDLCKSEVPVWKKIRNNQKVLCHFPTD
ncbi:ABC transporter ATP-binding protein [Leptospira noguchii]|uniref:Oligopeptide/dipeptide transporter, C-terminal domain protein n=1 Tax=Leptospira noguchii str. 2007001578 TaxID=1049974 RepID=A0ABP2TEH5_9LEPT|nr:ABC transporter ATP-binding protein [Leptospira noguchii]EKR73987.1 oligopeptide/dipeptide transporter, C-terminal domain protein [Leptospira noguchii str. 2006001870]EMI66801.1 oligopeptide/dipeptide transporter, C-terminal domain protein [Leptospira noguchii str. Bonito]EMN02620.1 oligopeptide/dipeptide transporter, C-terminal domain protein [Leptospira noguchii str. 2007001578]EMS84742.1 oligopeptide/dipeptide transporter, C-terminal domain protein [Leptospira noguchii str. Cascata]EPE86